MITIRFIICFLGLFCFSVQVFAIVPTSQQASGQEGLKEQQERERRLRQRIERPLPQIDKEQAVAVVKEAPSITSQKVLVKKIVVTGNILLAQAEIDRIIHPFEGKELAVAQMQRIADFLTDAFRQKGFITTRALIPPQKIANDVLEIKIVTGFLGEVAVQGNKYFNKSLFTKRLTIKKGEPFNYNELRSNLFTINQYPDRNVKAVLIPGQSQGETDLLLEVKDRFPAHVGMSYDNFGSKYLGRSRYLGTLTHNNLFGFDDILTLQYQQSEAKAYRLQSARYLLPVTNKTQVGVYSTHHQVRLQREFKDLNARGKSKVYGIFVNHAFLSEPDLRITGNLGFDYKNVYNFILDLENSRDIERVTKLGGNIDYMDPFGGRNIINNEINFGIPNIMGANRSVDSRSSVVGSGGRFTKDIIDYLRLQSLPFDTSLFFKFEAQFASRILNATEQYQLGGISNVRGFAPGEAVGDSGETVTAEYALPFYPIPRHVKVPFSSVRLYDALKLAVFYDWGHVSLRNPQAGESKQRTLDSYGWGLRFNLPENFFVRIDMAWALAGRPSDDHGQHTWFQITKEF